MKLDQSDVSIRKGLITGLKASGGNVKTDAASEVFPGQVIICGDNSVTPPVEVLPPIQKGVCTGGWKQASQAEQRKIAFIGRTEETITASTRYAIEIHNDALWESVKRSPWKYATTSNATLTGTAATDRHNIFTALAALINASAANGVEAFVVHKVAYTVGDTAVPVVGETITQATSGATAKIAAVVQTGGTITGGDGAGFLYLYDVTGTWSASSLVSTGGSSTGVMTTNAALTDGAGLVIRDDANYYAPRPNSRRGKSAIYMTQGWDTTTTDTIDTNVATIAVGVTTGVLAGLPGLYSVGIGSRMLLDMPVFTPDGVAIVSGEAWFQPNAAPDSSKTYTTFILEIDPKASDNVLTGYGMNTPSYFLLFADEANGTYLTALETAIESGLGITIA